MDRSTPFYLYEDDHLLVVSKPPGWNTHAPSPYANEGIYDWLRHRKPQWASLAIVHRLDKETSGILAFTKTPLANKSLTQQFSDHQVQKRYFLLADRPMRSRRLTVRSKLTRAGERYVSVPNGQDAETEFEVIQTLPASKDKGNSWTLIEARPRTGRTHQIRVHAAESGFPILGDSLYGGGSASRVCLHAARLELRHPETGHPIVFEDDPGWNDLQNRPIEPAYPFGSVPSYIEPAETDCYRVIHGASQRWPGWYVERLGEYLLSQSETDLSQEQQATLDRMARSLSKPQWLGTYHKSLIRRIRGFTAPSLSPRQVAGVGAPDFFRVRENGIHYELSFSEGYSMGLFLDQRDNRRRWLTGHVSADFGPLLGAGEPPSLLNSFAYTCGFSVAAALAGWKTTSLDLSKKYLEWGKRNFDHNQLDVSAHDFVYGDVFDWLARWRKKGRLFHGIILDPPTFSQSKTQGRFQVERDYGRLVESAVAVLERPGVLLASTNAAGWDPADFVSAVVSAVQRCRRKIIRHHYVPQPPDFPISKQEPGHLKTLWLRLG